MPEKPSDDGEALRAREAGEWILKVLGDSVEARFDDQAAYNAADELFHYLELLDPKRRSVLMLQVIRGIALFGIASSNMAELKVLVRDMIEIEIPGE